jgi:alkanesulfonate monooxygenase SsuD/methylene tetrahydromethanopterin reductase-like flavin-dependent oxidoreductase (luciferase family)
MNTISTTGRGLGLAVAITRDVLLAAGKVVGTGGYSSFWLNNPPGADALSVLGEIAPLAPSLRLGVGVIPLTSADPGQITSDVHRVALPVERLYLGIGSGAGPAGLQRIEAGLQRLRNTYQGDIVVAALGPRMCRLAGSAADGVLFNWLTPEYASRSITWVQEGAGEAGRPMPQVFAYVRVGLGEAPITRLRTEATTYESYPAYAAHFKRMGVGAMDTTIAAITPEDIQSALAAWEGVVDEVVVRAITLHDTADEVLQVIDAARPR